MKREELLDAFSGVDEELLLESEEITTRKPRRILWRAALVAAICTILAVTAAAATALHFLSLEEDTLEMPPVQMEGDPLPGVDGNPWLGADGEPIVLTSTGRKVCLDIETNEDIVFIQDSYLVEVPDTWEPVDISFSPSVLADGTFGVRQYTLSWLPEGYSDICWFTYHQVSVYDYNRSGTNCMHTFNCIPYSAKLTSEFVTIADISMLKVTVPPINMLDLINMTYIEYHMPTGETWLFWSDGGSIFKVSYPSTLPEETVEEILSTLYKTDDIVVTINTLREDAGMVPLETPEEFAAWVAAEYETAP